MDIAQLGRYQIRAELGRGGMAVVYLAHDPQFGRDVALKVLPREFSHSTMFRERFSREARVIAALEHPAIVPVYDFGQDQGFSFFVMRYMGGGSLRERIRSGRLQLQQMLTVVDRIAAALDLAHAQGIVHRDLKPANILFDQHDNPYLSDFGIVRLMEDTANLTGTGFIGTAAYTSPEQVQGAAGVDGRSDVYTLGIIIYEMLTGRQPYQADTPTKQMMAHVLEPVPDLSQVRPDLPRAVVDVVSRAMAKEPDQRFQSAGALAGALRAAFGAPTAVGRTESAPPPRPAAPTMVEPTTGGPSTGPAAAQTGTGRSRLGPLLLGGGVGLGLVAVLLIGAYFLFFNNGADGDLAATAAATSISAAGAPPATDATPTPGAPAAASTRAPATRAAGNGDGDAPTPLPSPTLDPGNGDSLLVRARDGEFAGSTVTIFGAFVDEDARRFDASVAAFEAETGIDIQYEGSGDFETLIQVRVQGGDPPDIGFHPQPGLLKGLVEAGAVVDPSPFLGMDFLERQYARGWIDDSTLGGQIAGVWMRASVKSLIWYPKREWEAAGYPIPASWEEMEQLLEILLAEGQAPWCIGIESGGATGWVATDWIEDIMLRTQPPAVYDAWVAGDLPFNSPEVRNAFEILGGIWFRDDFVLGGTTGILTTPFGDSPNGLFDNPPSCWMHRQASFIPAFFPDDVVIGRDVDFFVFPSIEPQYGTPLLTAGDIAAMYNDRPEVRAVMAFLATGESVRGWVEAGGFISPHQDSSPDWYASALDRRFAELLLSTQVTRFDGSDLMPAPVGAGAFWIEITEWIAGGDLNTALRNIDAAWPR